MRCCVIIQARLGSSRLPAKLALDLCGAPLLHRVIERAALARHVDQIVVATSDQEHDDVTADIAKRAGTAAFRGSLEDARDRFIHAANEYKADFLIRLTADNPFVEPSYIEELIALKMSKPEIPYIVHDLSQVVHGTASELVDVPALEEATRRHTDTKEKEHITPSLRNAQNSIILSPPPHLADPHLSLSVDKLEDYVSVCRLFERFGAGRDALPGIVAAVQKNGLDGKLFRSRE